MKPLIAALLFAALVHAAPSPALAAKGLPSTSTAWLSAAADADIERAFVQARREKKPVLLYWGASWCPPCNQLKATLFNRQDFATLSRSFVAVHVDGDLPGAQKLGKRFQVSGYPTLVLFDSQGQELTRLPGEVDPPQVMAVLQQGLSGGRPVKAALADALAGKRLSASDWRLLAFYSWDTDEQQLLPRSEVAGTLARLAVASPAADAETSARLWLKALAASDDGQGFKPDAALRARVLAVLADPAMSRLQMDVVTASADRIVRVLEPDAGAGRAELVAAFEAALTRLQGDATLSRGDRMGALHARVLLARIDLPKDAVQVRLPTALLSSVREQVQAFDREIGNGYERQAVITFGAAVLARAGLWAESDALLQRNLARSHSPYYLMSQLGGNARRLGRNDEALRWYEQAFDKSDGPATRLQWGSSYLDALVKLAPRDAARIERTTARILSEAAGDAGAFEGRSIRSLQRVSAALREWNAKGEHAAVLQRLQAQLDGVCAKVDAGSSARQSCDALLKPNKAAA